VYQAVVYRRDADDKLVILFVKPQAEAARATCGSTTTSSLRPTVGKWERRTERERIGGTGSNRQDFDESRLASRVHARRSSARRSSATTRPST
jgi:hypothetical protein